MHTDTFSSMMQRGILNWLHIKSHLSILFTHSSISMIVRILYIPHYRCTGTTLIKILCYQRILQMLLLYNQTHPDLVKIFHLNFYDQSLLWLS